MDIKLASSTIKIADGVPWIVMSKILTARMKDDVGALYTEVIVGLCVAPKYTYEGIMKIDGFDMLELGTRIMQELKLNEKIEAKMEDLKKKDDNPLSLTTP